ncbi:MAG TPA: DUF6758 family protein [Mycobacteriales bacterium]|nr:DUF6758 family protein [Mycobacteriales bacterium]
MAPAPTCPRCEAAVRPPGLWSSQWQCPRHGLVLPYTVYTHLGAEALQHIRSRAAVPLWLPNPLPPGWVVSGLAAAGDDRSGARATVLACSGPGPLGGGADLLLIAEEPGVGLGARYAGLPGPDPGEQFDDGPPDAKVQAAGHPTALWNIAGAEDRAVFLGEAKGLWLWGVLCPSSAGVLFYENLVLEDLRERQLEGELEFGSPTPLLTARPA